MIHDLTEQAQQRVHTAVEHLTATEVLLIAARQWASNPSITGPITRRGLAQALASTRDAREALLKLIPESDWPAIMKRDDE